MSFSANTATFLQNHFDKIFVVSVPRFTGRHTAVTKNLQGLSFNFFWGTDKQDLDLEVAKKDGTYDEAITIKKQRQVKPMNPGELACSLSHRSIYAEMIKNNWQRVLILEDDVVPIAENLAQLPDAVNELPPDWELVYFGYLKNETVTAKSRRKQFFYKIISALGLMKWSYTMVCNMLPTPYSKHLKKAGFHDCTHAYAITFSAAKKLYTAQNPVVYRADDLLSHTILKGEIKAYVTNPKFFDQEGFNNSNVSSEIK